MAKDNSIRRCGDQTVGLARDDSVHYRGDVAHALRNVGKGLTEVYLIVRYRADGPPRSPRPRPGVQVTEMWEMKHDDHDDSPAWEGIVL